MSIYTSFLKHIFLPLGDVFFRTTFTKQLKKVKAEATLSDVELVALQRNKLEQILTYATQKSPYYRNLNAVKHTNPVSWLKGFPVLTKEILSVQGESLLTQPVNELYRHGSSGSTGVQAIVYWSAEQQDLERATQVMWWEWAGYTIGNPLLQTGITPNRSRIKAVKDFFFRTYYLVAFAHRKEDSLEALRWAMKQSNPIVAGYASSLFVLAKQAEESGLRAKFSSAITWGDKVFVHYRETIERVFQTKVYETYGAAEGFKIGMQKDLPYLYIMTNHVYIELLDDNGKEVEDGEMGHVVVTSLTAFAMPLIRYRIGDMAIRLPRDRYPKRRDLNFPLFEKIVGRDTDLVKTRSGKYMVVHSFTGIFEHIPEIKQFSVIQNTLDSILIEYIPGIGFNENKLQEVKQKINGYIGDELNIEFNAVHHISPTKSGKPQIVRSNLPKSEL